MDRSPAHVADLLQFVGEACQLLADKSLSQFLADRVLCLAVEKLFINMGEAARRVDPGAAASIPGVPWSKIIGLRNILAHGYEQVDHEVLFKAVQADLPAVEQALKLWLDGLPGQ